MTPLCGDRAKLSAKLISTTEYKGNLGYRQTVQADLIPRPPAFVNWTMIKGSHGWAELTTLEATMLQHGSKPNFTFQRPARLPKSLAPYGKHANERSQAQTGTDGACMNQVTFCFPNAFSFFLQARALAL